MKTKRKIIAIVAGGSLTKLLLPQIQEAGQIIGVDRGALWLLTHGVVPDVAVGDFDSVSRKEFRRIQASAPDIHRHPVAKNATDLELAADVAVGYRPDLVQIYGALGSRFDHSVGAMHVLLRLVSHNIMGGIVDNFNKIHIVRREMTLDKDLSFRYVSIFAFPVEAATVSLDGFRYPLSRFRISSASTRSVSNEIADSSARIRVHDGSVVVIQSRNPR